MNEKCKCNQLVLDISLLDDYMLELNCDYHMHSLESGNHSEEREEELKEVCEVLIKEIRRRYE